MYEKILVAIDRSAISQRVWETALSLSQKFQSELNLVHVLSVEIDSNAVGFSSFTVYDDVQMLQEFQEESERRKKESLENLQYMVNQALEKEVQAICTQLYGDPAKAICDSAQKWNADLIVMGRRGHSTVSELFLGSVSSSVIHRCHCAVHLVQI